MKAVICIVLLLACTFATETTTTGPAVNFNPEFIH